MGIKVNYTKKEIFDKIIKALSKVIGDDNDEFEDLTKDFNFNISSANIVDSLDTIEIIIELENLM